MRSFLGRVVIGVLLGLLCGRSPSAASGQCTSFGGCCSPGVQIMRASVVNDQLQLEVVQMVCEYVTKQVTIQVEDHQETKTVQECVMRPTIGTQWWALSDVKLYRGDRRRVQASAAIELLAEPQYVLVCQLGQKLAKEWADLLRPETLVVFLTQPQIVAASAVAVPAPAAPIEVVPPMPGEIAPQPGPVEVPPPAPVEVAPQPAPLVGETPPAGAAPLVPPDLIVAKVEEGSLVVRSVAQHEFEQLLTVGATDADGNPSYETVRQVTQSKTETLVQLPADAIHAWQADGTAVDGDDLAARLKSYAGVLAVSSAEPVAEEFLELFQAGVLVVQAPSANVAPAMGAPVSPIYDSP